MERPATPPRPLQEHAAHFARLIDYRQTPVGHNTPGEDPGSLATAILDLHGRTER